MSKSIIELDTPRTCCECPALAKEDIIPMGNYTYKQLYKCRFAYNRDYLEDPLRSKPDWCPLKEVSKC